ncbi:transmembrane and ubiquitin-like domain-containing protein 1 [Paramormyrops kingsleyae]|uniref:Transmembrane and ubiquitin-like domain-containing protein 1 n=1 Tax=Paramormyrops kingsleyae TaxID=1676925 RepID=A0A3B3T9B5_9TELE|nr:transmembrane and ubiquitin-like domain-containing protein 1 [Paramormyrops kingsleyae]XP_023671995.1 transmembrane and ubiquitin-like domain-containing protein 1 [Paramormyrops kingsleyae]
MALIEGVGDEVTVLFGVVLLLLVLVLAWASTHTADRTEHLFASGPATAPLHRSPPSQENTGHDASPLESPPAAGSSEEGSKEESPREAADGEQTRGGAGGRLPELGEFGVEGLRHRETVDAGPSLQQPSHDGGDTSDDAQRNMVLRLKFLNDTERVAQVKPEDTIGYIKRTYFAGQEHQVRLIYQGQLLRDDAQTLASLNLADNCVLHCHISQHATPQVPAGARAADQVHVALNVGSLMVPLFVLMLSVLWYFQIQYRHFFTAPATASLVGITIFFSFVAFGVYRR